MAKADISEQESKAIRDVFAILDDDGDGKVSKEDVETLLRAQFVVASDQELTELLRQLDSDHNGSVNYAEFESFVGKRGLCRVTATTESQEMRDAFAVFDSNGDGFIDVTEFSDVMQKLGDKMTVEKIRNLMKEADVNHDGKIDYKEFCAFIANGIFH